MPTDAAWWQAVTDLARQLAALIEGRAPAVYCCDCLAAELAIEQGTVREAAQLLLISVSERFETVRRTCAGCGQADTVVALLKEE